MVENKFNIELSLVSHYTKLTYFNAKTSTTQKKNTSFSTIQKTFSVKCWEKLSNLTHFRSRGGYRISKTLVKISK